MKLTTFPSHPLLSILFLFFFFFPIFHPCFSPVFASATDTLTPSESFSINQTLVSAARKFELAFLTIANPTEAYLGIWYHDISPKYIVWIANRDAPSFSNSSSLKLEQNGTLMILDGGSRMRWSSNQSTAVNPVLQLLDSGNLVIREAEDQNPDNYIWQSFDNPTDTLLPDQKLGWNLKTGLNRFLTSWRGPNDPGTGNVSLKLDPSGDPQLFLRNGNQIFYRSGPWVGLEFSGVPDMMQGKPNLNFTFNFGPNEVYYAFHLLANDGVKSRLIVTYDGFLRRWTWEPAQAHWVPYGFENQDQCDTYRLCGPYGVCNTSELFVCQCPHGFRPMDQQAWDLRDGSSGCVRKSRLDCGSDRFLRLENMKLPDTSAVFVDWNMTLDRCKDLCQRNCRCMGYANSEVVENVRSGCIIWTGALTDMRSFVQGGQDLYIRLAASDLGDLGTGNDSEKAKKVVMGVGIAIAVAVILVVISILIILKCKNAQNTKEKRMVGKTASNGQIIFSKTNYSDGANKEDDDYELPMFDLHTIVNATNNFSDANKLGQGGFGRVYKAVLLNGNVIAVKRLSRDSGQGVEQFKNEVRLIAKLQHRNLVQLLGCCVEMEEKILIYEYLQNKSLDSYLFHKEKNSLLNWQTRFNIICGIARGLLYLHQDSRYRIIHRDMKASNILLDGDMKPKISDFGMARLFGGDETEGNTKRVVGTYGYMAPEYAMDGVFSIKSDVFSFGVLVLEVISGKKNRGFYNSDDDPSNLLKCAFKLWKEGKGTEFLDKSMGDSYSIHEVLRCLQVGLLCVQEKADERPAMTSVVLMLSSESACLPQPKFHSFDLGWNPNGTDSSSSMPDDNSFTVNQVTITMLTTR